MGQLVVCAVFYRDFEDIVAERCVDVEHATLNRWVARLTPLIAIEAHKRKQKTATSWRMDETYVKMKGKWPYSYRVIDKYGKTLDFILSERRDESAAAEFFMRAVGHNSFPNGVVIDKIGANLPGLHNMNYLLILN